MKFIVFTISKIRNFQYETDRIANALDGSEIKVSESDFEYFKCNRPMKNLIAKIDPYKFTQDLVDSVSISKDQMIYIKEKAILSEEVNDKFKFIKNIWGYKKRKIDPRLNELIDRLSKGFILTDRNFEIASSLFATSEDNLEDFCDFIQNSKVPLRNSISFQELCRIYEKYANTQFNRRLETAIKFNVNKFS